MGMIRPYRDELAQQIKEAGQQLIGDAEKMIGEGSECIADVIITITLGMRKDEVQYPEIETSIVYGTKATLERWSK